MATKDRTALKDEFKNGNLATGERFADLIDSMKVVQLPVVDPQALGTSLSFIDSISQDEDGKITATKKTLDLANAHELNPFKGWYKTGDTLPTDGFDGAYLYFKDTSELTGQTTIYRWNGTTYADTGTVVDTSNVQTFETGQAVNETAIDNTVLVNPGENALAKAVDMMQLAAKLEGVTRVADKVALIDNSTFFDGKYVKNNKTIQNAAAAPTGGVTNGIAIVNVEGYDKVRFLGYATNANPITSGYGFSANAINPNLTTVQLDTATAYRGDATEPMAVPYEVDVPDGMKWFACTVFIYGTPETAVMTKDDFYCYKINGNLPLTTTDVDDTPQPYSDKVVKSGGLYDALYSKINVDLSTLPQYQSLISTNQNVWTNTGTNYKCVMLQVVPGEEYVIKASDYSVFYALLKTSDRTVNTAPNYATGESVKRISPKNVEQINVPEDAHFMYILVVNNGTDVTPESIFKTGKSCNERIYDLKNTIKELYISNPFTLTGVGMTGAVNTAPQGVYKTFKLEDGAKYILRVDLSTFIYDEIATGWNIYSLAYSINGSVTNVFTTIKDRDALVAEHNFTAVEADYYAVTIRANDGQVVEFDLVNEETALVENSPKEKSTKLITSGGVYDALQGGSDIVSLNNENNTLRYLRNLLRPAYLYTTTVPPNNVDSTTPFTLLHFSDLHGDALNLTRIVEFHQHYSGYIDDVIATGDIIMDQHTDSFEFWHGCGADSVLLSTGNHEYYLRSDTAGHTYENVTPLEVYNKFFAPYISNWGTVVFPSDANTVGKCYYYKDYADKKIRLVVLDNMANMNPDARPNTDVQATWLAGVLESARLSDYHVICAIHIGSTLMEPFETAFMSRSVTIGNTDEATSGANRKSYSEFYALRNAVEQFIDNGGHFVAWIAGHRHSDAAGILYSEEEGHLSTHQAIVCVATAAGGNTTPPPTGVNGSTYISGHVWWIIPRGDDSDRMDGTKGQDCLNLYAVDTKRMILSVHRIGCDLDKYGRHKGNLVYDYGNHEMIYTD